MVVKSSPGIWRWNRGWGGGGGLFKYKKEVFVFGKDSRFREDVVPARDCITRAYASTWWY